MCFEISVFSEVFGILPNGGVANVPAAARLAVPVVVPAAAPAVVPFAVPVGLPVTVLVAVASAAAPGAVLYFLSVFILGN